MPDGGIAELPDAVAAAGDDGLVGNRTGLLAGTIATIAAGTVALGGAARYARRRWAR